MRKLSVLLLLLLSLAALNAKAQCGLDIFVVNDQSGSVDATENAQARDFILKLAQAHTLGNANTENRIAVSEFDESYHPYSFPAAGPNYTINMADLLAYKNAVRSYYGGTYVNTAILNGAASISQTPVPGRTVRKVLVIMTDASPGQASASLVTDAGYAKDAGDIVVVLAIGPAVNIPILADAATPGLYYTAADYVTLQSNAATIANNILSGVCAQPLPAAGWDLSAAVNSFDCGAGTVNYTIANTGSTDFSGPLQIAFYNGDPATAGSSLAITDVHLSESIAAAGTKTYSITSAALQGVKQVAIVANLDTANTHAQTPLPYNLRPRLTDTTELNPFNNISTTLAGVGCAPYPQLEVSNKLISVSCDKKVTWQVQICNTGNLTATAIIPRVMLSNPHLVLVSSSNDGGGAPVTASMANPGTDTAGGGYDGYSSLTLFPNPSNGYTSAQGATFKYAVLSNAYYANGVFSFPPVSAGSGVPYGATILSAKLTAKIGGPANGLTSYVSGIKITNAGPWDNTANHPGDAWAAHPTGANVPVTSAANMALQTLDVTSVAQELVNQQGWTENSEMAFFWHGAKNLNSGTPPVSTLQVKYTTAPNVDPGNCLTFTYVFQDTSTAAVADTSDASVTVSTATPGAVILPDANFAVDTFSGLNGFNGTLAAHTSDNVIIPATTGCTQTPQAITTSVSITPASICAGPGSYVTATVTINNPNTQPAPSGITLYNLVQNLNLIGTGAVFAGEPYNLTNGLELATPAILSAAYPNVAYALSGKSGLQQLPVLQLPSGTSTFQVDIAAGTGNFNMSSFVNGIAPLYNAGGSTDTVQDATGVTVNAAPAITWTCPAAVTAGSVINLNATTTGAATVTLMSASAGTLTNTGSVAAPAATYTPTAADVANGYAAVSITALSAGGCDAAYNCQVSINGVSYDYGDAPLSYDLGDSVASIAAGSTIIPDLYLGLLAPGTETAAKAVGSNASGDGGEEDGLVNTAPVITIDTATYQVRVTNNTATPAYVTGFVDYGNDGNFNAAEKRSARILIPANSGTALYNMIFVRAGLNAVPSSAYMRLRLSTDSTAVTYPFGVAPEGEVEDYLVSTNFPLPIRLSSFTAKEKDCNVTLNWEIAGADNFSHFTLERSSAGNDFRAVATFKYEDGKKEYAFTDVQPGAARWYYRLKLTDLDGSYDYSGIAALNLSHCAAADAVRLYPNPAADRVVLTCPASIAHVEIVSLSGKVLYSYTPAEGATSYAISLEHIQAGIYLVRTAIGNGAVDIQRLIRE